MKKSGLVFVGMGFELLGLILASLYIGKFIDQELQSQGLGVGIMVVLGMIGWFMHLIVLLKKFMKEADRDREKSNNS